MKKYVLEVIQIIIAYIGISVYGYYNISSPDNHYSWLIAAIIVISMYVILKLANRKRKNQK